jgi:hypothetical protein
MNGPPSEKAAPVLDTQEAAGYENANRTLAERLEESKRFVALESMAAKAGHTLTRTSGGYMLQRWSYSKHLVDLDGVAAALAKMGVRA